MADETTAGDTPVDGAPKTSGNPLSGPVSGFVDTVHTPQRDPVGTVGAEYIEGTEQGYIGVRTDENEDDSVYQAPNDGTPEEPKTSFASADNERDAQIDTEANTDYEAMTVEELSDELRDRNLPVSGVKAEQIERLQDDDAGA